VGAVVEAAAAAAAAAATAAAAAAAVAPAATADLPPLDFFACTADEIVTAASLSSPLWRSSRTLLASRAQPAFQKVRKPKPRLVPALPPL